jgi:hypothetical protein
MSIATALRWRTFFNDQCGMTNDEYSKEDAAFGVDVQKE